MTRTLPSQEFGRTRRVVCRCGCRTAVFDFRPGTVVIDHVSISSDASLSMDDTCCIAHLREKVYCPQYRKSKGSRPCFQCFSLPAISLTSLVRKPALVMNLDVFTSFLECVLTHFFRDSDRTFFYFIVFRALEISKMSGFTPPEILAIFGPLLGHRFHLPIVTREHLALNT